MSETYALRHLPLERRCEIARIFLEELSARAETFADSELRDPRSWSPSQKVGRFLADGSTPGEAEALNGVLHDIRACVDEFTTLIWTAGLDLGRKTYGSDAIDTVLAERTATKRRTS